MGSLTISNKILEKYFGYLKNLDIRSKKTLIAKLSESIDKKPENKFELSSIFGAWEDPRDSDLIVSEIITSRVKKSNPESFE
jgi:hypothetical protein